MTRRTFTQSPLYEVSQKESVSAKIATVGLKPLDTGKPKDYVCATYKSGSIASTIGPHGNWKKVRRGL